MFTTLGFPGGSSGREPACRCRRHEPWVRSLRQEDPPGGGHGNPLQYSWLENPMDRGVWRATVPKVAVRRDLAHTFTNLKNLDVKAAEAKLSAFQVLLEVESLSLNKIRSLT